VSRFCMHMSLPALLISCRCFFIIFINPLYA
jgi:hypothetical protein